MKRQQKTQTVSAAEALALQRRKERTDARSEAFRTGQLGPIKLLTEAEVATILRCSRSKVKGLRMSGRLSYLPLRPPMIEEADLHAYIEREKRRKEPSEPTQAEQDAKQLAEIKLRVRRHWLRKRFRGPL